MLGRGSEDRIVLGKIEPEQLVERLERLLERTRGERAPAGEQKKLCRSAGLSSGARLI